ncbi:MAG: Fe-S cluster assembly ATPase SufC [Bacilli bacterium]|jgi:Fe-S cluster assembly ATP-binding protein|nr:Fe-S cluster assembly ATPase SufC [Bacilli bacterium]MCH4201437.1 Fe-S cluster assembly ATPase SufC [Bacilli bacterium]MCH4235560.1 Fe-S cluster assembly ATPase SufC [Bacilli bacterium]
MDELVIKDLFVSADGKMILKGLNLTVKKGDVYAILGPNGHGKSTLLNAIMGHPRYQVESGTITFNGQDILSMSVDERSRAGIFLGMQYPSEVPGVVNADFIKAALNARREKPISAMELYRLIDKTSKQMGISLDMANRSLNEGFSGGEKKRNEIFQMTLIEPYLSMLDEIDSGLDVDALQVVANQINELKKKGMSFLIISHYARLYSLISPNKVAIIIDGRVVTTGGPELIEKVDQTGYEWISKELGISITKEDKEEPISATSIGICATKEGLKK